MSSAGCKGIAQGPHGWLISSSHDQKNKTCRQRQTATDSEARPQDGTVQADIQQDPEGQQAMSSAGCKGIAQGPHGWLYSSSHDQKDETCRQRRTLKPGRKMVQSKVAE